MDDYLIHIGDLEMRVGDFCWGIVVGCCGGLEGAGGIDGEVSKTLVFRSLSNLRFCLVGCVG